MFPGVAGAAGGGVSVSDQSATQSGGTFMPTFGAINLPKDSTTTIVIVAGALLVGVILWKKL